MMRVAVNTRVFPSFRDPRARDRLLVPFENTVPGYFSLPGFQFKKRGVCMIGTDKCSAAPESLEPDSVFAAVIAFLPFRHGNQTLVFSGLTFFRILWQGFPPPVNTGKHG